VITRFVGRCWLIACFALVAGCLLATPGAALAADPPLTVTVAQISATEGQPLNNVAVATFVDPVNDDTASDYIATIEWGDGTVTNNALVTEPNGVWTVSGSHTYAEEGTYTLEVSVVDTPGDTSGASQAGITVNDAGLALPSGSPTEISGAGGSAAGAMASFEGTVGGSDNGTTPGEQAGGYRHITWDDIALNGTDPGATTITPNHVVSVAPTREQARGIELGRGVAVANDGFSSVNPSVAGSFPAFSPPNVFAPFNLNKVSMQIVAPAAQSSNSTAAATRGLGIMFLGVQGSNTSIQYFSGSTLLYTAIAPIGGAGQPSFVGVLFPSPAVTQIVVNMGAAAIFNFDGSSVTSGPSDPSELVAADDVVLAEPAPTTTTILATAGVPLTGVIDSFSDTDPNGTASDYTADASWGDGTESGTSIGGSAAGFSVTGTHTYMKQGTYQVTTTVIDYGGSTQTGHVTIEVAPRSSTTSVSCSPKTVVVTNPTTCTATVSDVGGGMTIAPTGSVGFNSPTEGVSFSTDSGCSLKSTSTPGQSQCSVTLIPGHYPPSTGDIAANYIGDAAHSASSGSGSFTVHPEGCSVKLLKKRLPQDAKRLPVYVTCTMAANLAITVTEKMHGHKRITFAHFKTSVNPNVNTKIRTLIYKAGRTALRTAPKGRKMTLSVTVVATPISPPVTILLTVKGVKIVA